ncbi:hypothetical protein D3C81_1593980 [compost metagenome]
MPLLPPLTKALIQLPSHVDFILGGRLKLQNWKVLCNQIDNGIQFRYRFFRHQDVLDSAVAVALQVHPSSRLPAGDSGHPTKFII